MSNPNEVSLISLMNLNAVSDFLRMWETTVDLNKNIRSLPHWRRPQLLTQRNLLQQRPIVFVCHSLGGLVVKKALSLSLISQRHAYRDISSATKGVVFMGTPHSNYEPMLTQMEAIITTDDDATLNPALYIGSMPLVSEVLLGFRNLRWIGPWFQIFSFYEEFNLPNQSQPVSKSRLVISARRTIGPSAYSTS
jgi:hypothetical protein